MTFPAARAASPDLLWLPQTPSTNAALRERAAARPLPLGAAVITADQPAGRGRLGRSWELPPGRAIACSVLVPGLAGPGTGPAGEPLGVGWVPLLAGSALAAALRPLLPGAEVLVKWPNDVMVDGKKIAGILCELLPDGRVIVGVGVNLFLTAEELPTERATSLLVAGGSVPVTAPGERLSVDAGPGRELADGLLAALLTQLLALTDPGREAAGLRELVATDSWTLGSSVLVLLPGTEEVRGRAIRLAPGGELVVDREGGDGELTVAAGDVEHLR